MGAKRMPKKKCCLSKPRCRRCPLRMLAEGTLPDGYAVRRLRLVTISAGGGDTDLAKGQKGKKSEKGKNGKKRKKSR